MLNNNINGSNRKIPTAQSNRFGAFIKATSILAATVHH